MLIFAEIATYSLSYHKSFLKFCQTPVLGLGLGVVFTFTGDNHNHNNHNDHNHKNDNNPLLNFIEDKEKGVVIRDKG